MNKHISRVFAVLLAVISLFGLIPTQALAADETTIGTDSHEEIFEYKNESGWHDLKTPWHWDKTTGDVAYCLEHEKDSPPSGEAYTPFNPSAVYNAATRKGIQAILSNGYPVKDGGLSENQARQATACALRAWLKESAGIGYNFMNVSNGNIRPKSGQSASWDFFMSLLKKARDGSANTSTGGTVSVSPNPVSWMLKNGKLETVLNISSSDGYSITDKPGHINIGGFTGGKSEKLTVTAPLNKANETAQITFKAPDGEDTAELYWYEPGNNAYQKIVVVDMIPGGPGQKAIVTIKGEFYHFTLHKKDTHTGAALDGAVFELRQNGKAVGLSKTAEGKYMYGGGTTQFTTNGGTALIEYLPKGNYTLMETSAPSEGYVVSDTADFVLTSNKEMTVGNTPTELHINKTDKITGVPIADVEFRLKDSSGQIVKLAKVKDGEYRPDSNGADTFKTGSAGEAHIYYLPQGTYSIEELPLAGYAALPPQNAAVGASPSAVNVGNDPLTLEFEKTDALTGNPLDGAVFRLLDEKGNIVKLAKEKDGEYKPDANGAGTFTAKDGKAVIRYLTVQKYTVVEDTPPVAFMPDTDKPFTITWQNGTSNPVKQAMKDEPLTMEFTKLDSFTGLPMDGATFRFLDKDGNTVKLSPFGDKPGYYRADPNGRDIFTTSNGKATIYYLPVSTYTVTETKAATNYATASDRKVNVSIQNGFRNPAKLIMRDEPLMLEIRKKDASTGQPVGGAIFHLEDEDGNLIKLSPVEGKDGYYKPDENGQDTFVIPPAGIAKILYLPYQAYKVVEEQPAVGFALAGEDTAATITLRQHNGYSDPARVDVKNIPLAFELYKVDKTTRAPVSGAVFRLLDESGNVVKLAKQPDGSYKPDDKGSETFTADEKAIVKYIPVGKYTVEELSCPGYGVAAPQGLEITGVSSIDNPAKLTFENIPTSLIVEKKDATTGQPLTDATFRLLDEKGTVIKLAKQEDGSYKPDDRGEDTFTMDKDAKAVITHVPAQKLVIEEVTPPAGYGLAEKVETELTAAHTVEAPLTLTISDNPLALNIFKIHGQTKKPLSGAGFAIKAKGALDKELTFTPADGVYRYDENGKETTVMVGEQGKATVYGLPVGEYVLEETVVPDTFFPATPQDFTIGIDNTVENAVEVTVINEPFVKLGEDTDRNRLWIGALLLVLALGGGVFMFIRRKKK